VSDQSTFNWIAEIENKTNQHTKTLDEMTVLFESALMSIRLLAKLYKDLDVRVCKQREAIMELRTRSNMLERNIMSTN